MNTAFADPSDDEPITEVLDLIGLGTDEVVEVQIKVWRKEGLQVIRAVKGGPDSYIVTTRQSDYPHGLGVRW